MATKRVTANEIGMFILSNGFKAGMEKFKLKPARARDVVKAIKASNAKVPAELQKLADQVRTNTNTLPPVAGDERDYSANENARISIYGPAIGINAHDVATVKYETDRVIVTKKKKAKH